MSKSVLSSANGLLAAVDSCDLLVAVGAGGVGKTTTSAALGLLGAMRGRRTLVLTIDPARRLLQALGLHDRTLPPNEPVEVLPRMSDALGVGHSPHQHAVLGSLDAMMLDPEIGAEQMVERLLPDPALREEVMGNRIYRALLPALGASPDLVALELLADLHRSKRYDLIVLDTPPTHNTADFLAAGQTFANFINEGVLKWFAKVPAPGENKKPSLWSRGSSAAMGVLGRLFGAEILPDIAQFFRSFRDVMPAMRARSEATDALLRSDVTRFVAVTAPGETSLREAEHMLALLQQEGLPFAGFVVNRVLQAPTVLADQQRVQQSAAALRARLISTGMAEVEAAHLSARLLEGASRLHHLDRADAAHIERLRRMGGSKRFLTVVPQFEHDIHTLGELRDLSTRLVDGAAEDLDRSARALA
ncbi:MAG: ArsA family ATPase [Deltaproteobacteria bacterium]|nr:ArsA family ATPase [Deltaproteobacteria bacterium]